MGEWGFDKTGNYVHRGPYLDPLHTADEWGYCYLNLVKPRYQATMEAWLGRCPRTRDVRAKFDSNYCFFRTDETFRLELDVTGRMVVAHVTPEPGAHKLAEMMDLLPIHKAMIGARDG